MRSKETATVKWFDDAKGFGFLIDATGADVFVHYRSIDPDTEGYKRLSEGQKVEYLPVKTDKGISAQEVTTT